MLCRSLLKNLSETTYSSRNTRYTAAEVCRKSLLSKQGNKLKKLKM